MLTRSHSMPLAEVMRALDLIDTAPIHIGSFVDRFRVLNEQQQETAYEIARMTLVLMGVGG